MSVDCFERIFRDKCFWLTTILILGNTPRKVRYRPSNFGDWSFATSTASQTLSLRSKRRPQVTQTIRQLIIPCDPGANQPGAFLWWFRTPRDNDAWLKIPHVKVYGYQAGFWNMVNAIRRLQPHGFHRQQVLFSMPIAGGIAQALSEIGPSFKIRPGREENQVGSPSRSGSKARQSKRLPVKGSTKFTYESGRIRDIESIGASMI